MYGEDVEWSRRMQLAGFKVYVAGSARLWHGLSISSGGTFSPLSAYYQTRNSFVVCSRYAPLRGPRAFMRSADILAANLIHARRSRSPLVNVRAVLAGWRDYVRGRLGPCPPGLLPPTAQS
jgi:GT2 family glycosyltransferase